MTTTQSVILSTLVLLGSVVVGAGALALMGVLMLVGGVVDGLGMVLL